MDNMEQDPEEIPMDQVLAEIRQMLSVQMTSSVETDVQKPQSPKTPSVFADQEEKIPEAPFAQAEMPAPILPQPLTTDPIGAQPIPDKPKTVEPDYFLLTPAMRCDLPSDSELSETVQRQKAVVLNKLQQQSTAELSSALTEWLNANLPAMIEKALANKKIGG